MRGKTYKLQKLEKNRYSIFDWDVEMCFICGGKATDMHEIYCGAKRQVSMKNGFCVPLCRGCHNYITNNEQLSKVLKRQCQRKFEETHTRDEFIKLIGRNYL